MATNKEALVPESETGAETRVFTNEKFGEVRIVMRDGEPWFVAADICRALELGSPTMTLARLEDDEKMTLNIIEGHSGKRGGAKFINIITEPGLYALVLRSRKPDAKAFRRWITHEVIPDIRKHGVYAVEEVLSNPDMLINALQALKAERAEKERLLNENKEQLARIGEMEPRFDFCNKVLAADGTVTTGEVSKAYGKSAIWLNRYLAEKGIIFRSGNSWTVKTAYAKHGWAKFETFIKYDKAYTQLKWTQLGRYSIHNMLAADGIHPVDDSFLPQAAN